TSANAATILGIIPVSTTMRDFWLARLQNILRTGFIEYNGRPYQSYTMDAIQNHYSFAKDPDVKAAARMVLDYVSAKLAASSNDNRRAVPYRRRKSSKNPHLLGYQADTQSARMLVLAGDLTILKQASASLDQCAGVRPL